MTHRSRVCAILFDVNSQTYESTARFWSETLGRAIEFEAQAKYTALRGEIDFLVQNTDPCREGMHIDIETDDVGFVTLCHSDWLCTTGNPPPAERINLRSGRPGTSAPRGYRAL